MADYYCPKCGERTGMTGHDCPPKKPKLSRLERLEKAGNDLVDSLSDVEGGVAVVGWQKFLAFRDALSEKA